MDGANKFGARETFSRKEIRIEEGDVVEWTSKETISAHVLMSGSHSNWKGMGKTFISPMIKPEGVFRWQFNTFGVFPYCSATYKHVKGKIIVEAENKESKDKRKPEKELTKEELRKYIRIFRRRGWRTQKNKSLDQEKASENSFISMNIVQGI